MFYSTGNVPIVNLLLFIHGLGLSTSHAVIGSFTKNPFAKDTAVDQIEIMRITTIISCLLGSGFLTFVCNH